MSILGAPWEARECVLGTRFPWSCPRGAPWFVSDSGRLRFPGSRLQAWVSSSSWEDTGDVRNYPELLVWLVSCIEDNGLIKEKQEVDVWGLLFKSLFWKPIKKMLT